jgi:hypothetical protein
MKWFCGIFLVIALLGAVGYAGQEGAPSPKTPPCLQDNTPPEGGPYGNVVATTDELLDALWLIEEAGWRYVNSELCWDPILQTWGHLIIYRMP